MPPKVSKEDAILKLKNINLEMVNPELFVTTNTTMDIKCLTHNMIFTTSVGAAYRKAKKCKMCNNENKKTLNEYLNEKNIKLNKDLGDYGDFECNNCGYEWTTKKNNINFTNCQVCSGKKLLLDVVIDKLNTFGITLLNQDEFINTRTKGTFVCSNLHEWETYIHNVFSGKSGCPECSLNMGERKCKFILESLFEKKFEKTRKVVSNNLELDMYNEELKLALEYNGIQHYIEDKKYFHKEGGFGDQQRRDLEKKEFCEKNGINLIIVPYTITKDDELKEFIIEKITEYNYTNYKQNIDFKSYYMDSSIENDIFNSMKEYALKHNGKCLEHGYLGYDEKHEFECHKGHKFKFDGRELIRRQKYNSFCTFCGGKEVNINSIGMICSESNFHLISTEYKGCEEKLIIACDICDVEAVSAWDNLKQRQLKNGCVNCKNINEINEKIKNIGYKFADKVYIDRNHKHNYECINNSEHKLISTWCNMKIKKGKCKLCKK